MDDHLTLYLAAGIAGVVCGFLFTKTAEALFKIIKGDDDEV